MPFALFRAMNIFTTSAPDINPDQFMTNKPVPSTYHNDNVESSRFAKHVNDAERSLARPEPKKNNEFKTVQSESSQETEDTDTGQKISKDEHSKVEIAHEGKVSDIKAEKKPEEESTNADFEDNDINGDEVVNTDITENDKEGESDSAEGQAMLQGASNLSQEGSEHLADTVNNTDEADLFKPDINDAKYLSNSGETSQKENIQIIETNSDNITASEKQQGNTANDKGQITHENKDAAIEKALDEITSGELNAEEGQDEESGSDNKGFNKNTGFGRADLEELSDEFELNEDLKEKIRLSSTRELPDRYAKKAVIHQSENKSTQSQINVADPEVLEELNNFKTLQDGMLSGNLQNQANNIGINNAMKGVSDTTLNSLESIHSNTTVNNAEMVQNQAMTISGGKGAGLMSSNAARAAAFSEVLNQVVYVSKGKNKLGVTVNHDELGKLKIDVTMNKGILNIHVNASEKVVREFLESNVQSIIESLSRDGVSVGGFSVALKDHKDNPEKKVLMDSGLNRPYENIPTASVHSNRGLVNVFA